MKLANWTFNQPQLVAGRLVQAVSLERDGVSAIEFEMGALVVRQGDETWVTNAPGVGVIAPPHVAPIEFPRKGKKP